MNKLISIDEARSLIERGTTLSFAGPEAALDQLPHGRWIAGTIPYFMLPEGGAVITDGHVFATELSQLGEVTFESYAADQLAGISANAPDHGFALTIIPAGGDCHRRFAAEAADYPATFVKPPVGWIAGVHLSDLGKVTPKVYDGRTGTKFEDRAVVAYVHLPAGKQLSIEIVNLFEPDDGDVLQFDQVGSVTRSCRVNGEPTDFAAYIRGRGMEGGQLPLVGDYAGAYVNVSLQDVGERDVAMYAPVFPGVQYRFAKPVGDYTTAFRERLAKQSFEGAAMTCNCILNFVFGELEGKRIGGVGGPVTFGEIAYQLLNQTLVVVRVN